jgi:hypothetical protein
MLWDARRFSLQQQLLVHSTITTRSRGISAYAIILL